MTGWRPAPLTGSCRVLRYLGVVGIDEGVIDSNHFHVWVALRRPEHQAPNAAKAVDAHLGHTSSPYESSTPASGVTAQSHICFPWPVTVGVAHRAERHPMVTEQFVRAYNGVMGPQLAVSYFCLNRSPPDEVHDLLNSRLRTTNENLKRLVCFYGSYLAPYLKKSAACSRLSADKDCRALVKERDAISTHHLVVKILTPGLR